MYLKQINLVAKVWNHIAQIFTAGGAVVSYFFDGAAITFGGFPNGLMRLEEIMAALDALAATGYLKKLYVNAIMLAVPEQHIQTFGPNMAQEIDKTGRFPTENIQGLVDLGIMQLTIPEEYGGTGMDDEMAKVRRQK